MRYENFDLHIRREGDLYVAHVTDSPAGASQREVLRWPIGDAAERLSVLEDAIIECRNLAPRSDIFISPPEKILREFGADVFRTVFVESGTVAFSYRSSLDMVGKQENTGLRLNLRIEPPEMAMLPWEYVFDTTSRPDNYLCLRSTKRVSPIVRDLGEDGPATSIRIDGPVRVLAMIANPGGGWPGLDTEKERRLLVEVLGDRVTWVPRATLDGLYEAMQQGPWHIFHFIGHGGTDRSVGADGTVHSEGFLVMDDGLGHPVKASASRLGEILEDGKISLAVLNCCESARGNASSSVGSALVAAATPMAIAMQFPITNASASRFSDQFYKSLREGQTVESALTQARKKIRIGSDAEWAIPVFFTRVDSCVLFKEQPSATAAAPAPATATAPAATADAQAPAPARTKAQEEMRLLWASP
jgi:CHAT domain-containing protein